MPCCPPGSARAATPAKIEHSFGRCRCPAGQRQSSHTPKVEHSFWRRRCPAALLAAPGQPHQKKLNTHFGGIDALLPVSFPPLVVEWRVSCMYVPCGIAIRSHLCLAMLWILLNMFNSCPGQSRITSNEPTSSQQPPSNQSKHWQDQPSQDHTM